MNNNGNLESASAGERLKNIGILAVFSLLALLCSLLVMNLVAFPLSLFAIKHTVIYNNAVIYGCIAAAVIFMSIRIIRRIISLKKSGLSKLKILTYLLKRPFYYMAISSGFIVISLIIVAAIYLILSYNYYIIYKITNG